MTERGFILPEGLDEATGSAWGGQLSTERVDLLDTDTIVGLAEGDVRKTIEANKAYTSLRCTARVGRSSPSRGTTSAKPCPS